ncbi:uncharacterized protein TRIADDRAFT_61621 [Trichoplax adhaerens]|uniref:Branched-chain-amino-acid aminotransferase n=1 Tax=Trichoplax adhaerens TaxID=10228 RepID=B3SBH7_TRIAD|nr:hypothetical protein TRIADDRAFT_61621 [Trichoplax adhaerens]EDV19897.1 hypothetical protein TRIADDRAFT_61621 [Trichoplax adhaerens]|eukprot:XP_002117639.1 hypothetical protein TRIADDRAFT_61621 [Trichoplax adhaerens]
MMKAKNLTIERTENPKPKPAEKDLIFGHNTTDHMLTIEWHKDIGWKEPRIGPIRDLQISPVAKVFHYSLETFEGMKAYKGTDGRIRLFRPQLNMERMNKSAQSLGLPGFSGDQFLECLKELLKTDMDWVPESKNASLYIRPTMIGTDPTLGVKTSKSALLYIILCPVGAYFTTGVLNPIALWADTEFIRAWPGGLGWAKVGGNYGPTVAPLNRAEKHGCQQVLWLYGKEHSVTEIGTMNIFMYWINENGEKELRTPPLNGLILPGITRLSLLDIARQWDGIKVVEEDFTMKDVVQASKEDRLLEIFGAGTACVVSPVDKILYKDHEILLPTASEGQSIAERLYRQIIDIQYGIIDSDWSIPV